MTPRSAGVRGRKARPCSIAASAGAAMRSHAREHAPRECCGLLVGHGRRVDLALPMTNVARRATIRFRIDPAEHLAVRRVLRQITPSLQIVGVYHSHPQGPASPSERDVAEANYPEWLFVIIGRRSRTIGAFQIQGGSPITVPIRWRSPAGRPRTR